MDSYETERLIEIREMPSTVQDWHDGLELVQDGLSLVDAAGYATVVAGTAFPLASAIINHDSQELATTKLSDRYQHGTTDWSESGVKRSSDNASLIHDMSSYDSSQSPLKYQKTQEDSDAMSGFLAGNDEQQSPMEIENTDTDAGKTPSSTLYRSQYDNDAFLGSGSLLSKRLCMTPVNMKIGKRMRVDGIEPFLKNLMGNGHVTCQWNGIIEAAVGDRNPHFEFFRHRMAADTALTKSANYPTTVGHILLPKAATVTLNAPAGVTPATLTKSGFHTHLKNTQCWAPLNRADYEDMAWNLNKLKLSGQTTANNTVTGATGFPDRGANLNSMFGDNMSVLLTNMHRKNSAIQQNNEILPFASGSLTDRTKFKYDMVFNSGEITYNFVNANELPAIVDVIVYKPKKTAIFPSEIAAYTGTVNWDATTTTSYMLRLAAVLGDAYVAEVLQKFGTDNLGGRIPATTDISEDPAYPLFPNKMKKTIESQMPYNEVQRLKFALPSGGKRKITITLPGDRYRPESIGRGPMAPTMSPANTSANPADYQYPALDSHSYAICIACSGSKVAADYRMKGTATQPPVSNIVGDTYAPCAVQYYAEYTEHIQAAVYRNEGAKRIFCNAMTEPPTVPNTQGLIAGANPIPTVVCPLENMVRTGTQHIQSSNLGSTAEAYVQSSTGQSSAGADL